MVNFKKQIHQNLVALISLAIAFYAVWRGEVIDKNRTVRSAGFEILKNLGELQILVNDVHYNEKKMNVPFSGWGRILLVNDLGELMPKPVPQKIAELNQAWQDNWKNLEKSDEATKVVSDRIDESRTAVLNSIKHL